MLLRKGDVALLTGASRGLGPHLARALAGRSLNLVLAARSAEPLEALAQELRAQGVEVLVVPTDLRDQVALERLLDAARSRFGRVDLLVNNAGLAECVRFEHSEPSELTEMIDVNLRAPILLSNRLWPEMLARGRGHVVNVASIAGLFGSAYNEAYCATKHGLVGFTRALRLSAQDVGSKVSASVICPGFIDGDGQYEVMKRDFAQRAPRVLGSLSVSKLGPALLHAIEADVAELILTPTSQRPALALQALWPRLLERMVGLLGVNAIFRAVADRRLAARNAALASSGAYAQDGAQQRQ